MPYLVQAGAQQISPQKITFNLHSNALQCIFLHANVCLEIALNLFE